MNLDPPKATSAPLGPDATFQRHLEQGELRLQRCVACRRHVFQPRVLCPHCGADRLDWQPASGRGVVHACSLVMGKPGTGSDYAIVLVDLDEGVRMMGRVDGMPQEAVRIGLAVQARIRTRDGRAVVVFEPAPGAVR